MRQVQRSDVQSFWRGWTTASLRWSSFGLRFQKIKDQLVRLQVSNNLATIFLSGWFSFLSGFSSAKCDRLMLRNFLRHVYYVELLTPTARHTDETAEPNASCNSISRNNIRQPACE